jgi:CRISPR/Cas system CSM-associated protein Csm3 (group 7 of RAMP superfamily)
MNLRGKLYAESPIYRGNARKTLFTRDGDGKQRLVSLASEIAGTAQSLMDAFIGQAGNGRNEGLINRLWRRLYGQPLPQGLITRVACQLQEDAYATDRFFDLRMGLRLDEDRWAAEANANYKMETIFRNSAFDFQLQVNDNALKQGENAARLYYLLRELSAGRFWFGAGKSKGMGRCRLEIDLPFAPATPPALQPSANHLTITCSLDAANPIFVGWNWGKIDPALPAFAAIDGRTLLTAMRTLPAPIRQRLELSIGGPILSAADWKKKLAAFLPRAAAIWLREQSSGESETWQLPAEALNRLGKDKKYPLSAKVIANVQSLTNTPFPSKAEAESAITWALGDKANLAGRIVGVMTRERRSGFAFNQAAWQTLVSGLNLDPKLESQVAAQISNEGELTATLNQACLAIITQLSQQVDQQIRLLQSDNWVDVEIENRLQHVKIKEMLRDGKISERQWGDANQPPAGVTSPVWREFLASHNRVRYQHMLNVQNLNKSITNDRNFIEFLQSYRQRARQELAQPIHIEYRAGGSSGRDFEQRYGHTYDNIFMRMLVWKPSAQNPTAWEAYIPGSTLKGAFRRRASQVLKTLWGESERTNRMIDWLFGKQGQVGRVYFSDAYLVDPGSSDRAWCSMDGIRVDPATAQPVDGSKMDYLYAYSRELRFHLRLDLYDLEQDNLDAVLVLQHLLQDFQRGDIPLGGQKTSGMGWVQVTPEEVIWLTAQSGNLSARLFPGQSLAAEGMWHRITLSGEAAAQALRPTRPLAKEGAPANAKPIRTHDGFISHRAFGGYCGTLFLEAEVLRPIHIQESGQPSYSTVLDGQTVNGWDFFAMAPPEVTLRSAERTYALPSRSLKGMVRHLYTIASDARTASRDLSSLNPADSLFGWVGQGQNQAIMGRLAFSFAPFAAPELAWLKVPAFYKGWHYINGQWKQVEGQKAATLVIDERWRLFPHTPVAPIVQNMAAFTPDASNMGYVRAILPGARARFHVRFWNLEEAELQRLIWCLTLEENLAHKLGKHRYLGLGTIRVCALPDSFLTDWGQRYGGQPAEQGRLPLDVSQWQNRSVIQHYVALQQALQTELR